MCHCFGRALWSAIRQRHCLPGRSSANGEFGNESRPGKQWHDSGKLFIYVFLRFERKARHGKACRAPRTDYRSAPDPPRPTAEPVGPEVPAEVVKPPDVAVPAKVPELAEAAETAVTPEAATAAPTTGKLVRFPGLGGRLYVGNGHGLGRAAGRSGNAGNQRGRGNQSESKFLQHGRYSINGSRWESESGTCRFPFPTRRWESCGGVLSRRCHKRRVTQSVTLFRSF